MTYTRKDIAQLVILAALLAACLWYIMDQAKVQSAQNWVSWGKQGEQATAFCGVTIDQCVDLAQRTRPEWAQGEAVYVSEIDGNVVRK